MAPLKMKGICTVSFLLSSLFLFGISEAEEEWAIRLAGGKIACEGRVEVFRNNTWGTISNSEWDTEHAAVVCRQLDCGSEGSVTVPSTFGGGDGPVWHVICNGSEISIAACERSKMLPLDTSYSVTNVDFWDHGSDAGVRCHAKTTNVYTLNREGFKKEDFQMLLLTDVVIFVVLLIVLIILIICGVFAYRRFSRKFKKTSAQREVKASHKKLPKAPFKEDEEKDNSNLYCTELMASSPISSAESERKTTKTTEFELTEQVKGAQGEEDEGFYISCE